MADISDTAPLIEAELQLGVAPAALRRLLRLPLLRKLKTGPARTRELNATYFDTEDHQFGRHGMALRVRRSGGLAVQTLKAAHSGEAGFGRLEWESPTTGDVPDLTRLADLDRLPWLEELDLAAPLEAVFTTTIRRTTWPLRLADGSVVELAADQGEIACEAGSEPVSEVELELKSGDPVALFALALSLHREIPVRLLPRSKSERGYALLRDAPPSPQRAKPVALTSDMDAAVAFKAIARNCLRQWDANEDVALAGEDAEGVHQMRVALRRLRSAFGVFREVLPPGADALNGELRWLAGELGAARDWDVFMGEVLAPITQRMSGESSLRRFAQIVAALRTDGHARAREAILSSRATALKLELGRWLLAPWPDDAPPVGPFADAALARRARKLRRLGRGHAALPPEHLHDLRLRAKRLRYAAEFFRALYRKGRVRRHVRALVAVQDVLGAINDGEVGARLLDAVAQQAGPQADQAWFNRARALIHGWYAAGTQAQLRHLPVAWAALAGQRRFWHKPPEDAEPDKD